MATNSPAARAAVSGLADGLAGARCALRELDLAHNAQLDEAASVRLANSLRALPRPLLSLQLDGCGLGPRAVGALGGALRERGYLPVLRRLTLAHNHAMGRDDGTTSLAALLAECAALTDLDVTHASLDMGCLLEALNGPGVRLPATLTSLHVGTNKLPRAASAALAELLSKAGALRQLGIARTQLLGESFELIFAALRANSRLNALVLDASENELGEKCARTLARSLGADASSAEPTRCTLCGLRLRSTSLAEGGVGALLGPLGPSLLQLDLSHNMRKKIVPWPSESVEIGTALADLLRRCTRLRHAPPPTTPPPCRSRRAACTRRHTPS